MAYHRSLPLLACVSHTRLSILAINTYPFEVATFINTHSPITSATWHPDGRLVVGCVDGNMCVFSVSDTGGVVNEIGRLNPLQAPLSGLIVTDRWTLFARPSSTDHKLVSVYESLPAHVEGHALTSLNVREVLSCRVRGVSVVAASHSLKLVALGAFDGSLEVMGWEGSQLKSLGVLAGHSSIIQSIAFTPDDAFIVTTAMDKSVLTHHLPANLHSNRPPVSPLNCRLNDVSTL